MSIHRISSITILMKSLTTCSLLLLLLLPLFSLLVPRLQHIENIHSYSLFLLLSSITCHHIILIHFASILQCRPPLYPLRALLWTRMATFNMPSPTPSKPITSSCVSFPSFSSLFHLLHLFSFLSLSSPPSFYCLIGRLFPSSRS